MEIYIYIYIYMKPCICDAAPDGVVLQ